RFGRTRILAQTDVVAVGIGDDGPTADRKGAGGANGRRTARRRGDRAQEEGKEKGHPARGGVSFPNQRRASESVTRSPWCRFGWQTHRTTAGTPPIRYRGSRYGRTRQGVAFGPCTAIAIEDTYVNPI